MSFEEFDQKFKSAGCAEEKVSVAVEFMRSILADHENLKMKDFWDARGRCVETFKEKMDPEKRRLLWSSYVELTTEAKQLKSILDEKANFAIEQIDLALDAIESDLQARRVIQTNLHYPPGFDARALYEDLQGEIHLLTTLGHRLNSLRKEAIDTEMRFKHRNRILKRISGLGDAVFPKKKELVKQLSEQFMQDVQRFVEGSFASRDEILIYQTLQKELTLNPAVFKEVRKLLSEAWNKPKRPKKGADKPAAAAPIVFDLTPDVSALIEKAAQGEDVRFELEKMRVMLKKRLESYRKEAGGSGFDFEKAMRLEKLTNLAKDELRRLEDVL